MSGKLRVARSATLLLAIGLLVGCASVPDDYRDPRDPWESYNRAVHKFNTEFDKAIFKPLAEAYRFVTPELVDKGVTNFFDNIRDFTSAVSNLLQFKLSRAATDVGRIVVNSTIGVVGLMDVASNMDLPSYKEDFGQTFGYWGIGPGPYFVVPILGPKTVRDTVSLVPDWYTKPTSYIDDTGVRIGLAILDGIDRRADLLAASEVLDEAALDPYSFTRDAYLQKRLNDVYDGNPPIEEEDYWKEELSPSQEPQSESDQ